MATQMNENAAWCLGVFRTIRIGGVWGIPRSAMIFTKRDATTLALTAKMPWSDDLPCTEAQLHEQQQEEFETLQRYMGEAGITVNDETPSFDPQPDEEPLLEEALGEPDIEYVLGVRLQRDDDGWCCPHGKRFEHASTRDIALLCLNECEP